MKIRNTATLEHGAVAVLIVPDAARVARHPFFKLFSKDDQKYLNVYTAKSQPKGEYATVVLLPGGNRVMLVGVGEKEKFTYRKSLLTARRIVVSAKKEKIGEIEISYEDFRAAGRQQKPETVAEVLATQCVMADFEFTAYKTPPKEGWHFVRTLFMHSPGRGRQFAHALEQGVIIGEEINSARVLANTPGGDMTPKVLADEAVKTGKRAGLKVKVMEKSEIAKLKMGGILGVSHGSTQPPRFIVMEYLKGKRNEAPVVLVGKGVTFDTGGLNLKPSKSLYEMHMDMSGGAAVIHVLAALSRLKAKKNVVGLVPAVENMPSGSSYRPGDLLRTMSGKTIEVLNTDAEGRVVLADALTYAERYKPQLVIDVATLTGAAEVALGQRASALFATDSKVAHKVQEAGETTGDFVWPLPLWEEYEEEIKGTFGDVANIGKTDYGGAIVGAVFLWQFIKGYPWVHLDIAPRMTAVEGEYLAKGAAGASISLLTHFVRSF